MKQFIKELRRRSVFQVAGLYLGISWVIIESASVILPELGAPPWLFRGIIFTAFLGFPVALVLAWVYEIADQGIARDEDAVEGRGGGRRMDFVVIGVLVVALGVSIYLNFANRAAPEAPPALTLLIANFVNDTNDPLFNGTLEQALTIGLEGAPFINAYPREEALRVAATVRPDSDDLNWATAELVGVREEIGAVLKGSVRAAGSGYRLEALVVEPQTQETLAEADAKAASKLEVLAAVGDLAAELRRGLGDVSIGERPELLTVGSLEAAQEYLQAQDLQMQGRNEEAIESYRRATELDPDFGRAFSGWALAASRLGRVDKSEELWQRALSLLDRMTERERYRTLGLYYLVVSRDYEKAVENYTTLVERFPADSGGHNNLAVAHFYLRQFDAALRQGSAAVEIYPANSLFRTNLALYAMYSSQFEIAATEAAAVIEANPRHHKAYLPLAIAALDSLALDEARAAYLSMADSGASGQSLSAAGLADLAIFEGRLGEARDILTEAVARDTAAGNSRGAAAKLMTLAEVHAGLGDPETSLARISESLALSRREPELVTAARLHVEAGRVAEAADIAAELAQSLHTGTRAYARVIEARLAYSDGAVPGAIDLLRSALGLSDLWLAHYELGRIYQETGHHAQALSEFELCQARRGEAYALFLDDSPTVRYAADLAYWLGRSVEALGMKADAAANYERYLAARSGDEDHPLVRDAAARLAQ